MKGVHDLPPKRATSDIDFGIMIKDVHAFDELKEYLIDVEGFVPSRDNAFVLFWEDQTQVDLMPFGDLERVSKGILFRDLWTSSSRNHEHLRWHRIDKPKAYLRLFLRLFLRPLKSPPSSGRQH